MTLPPYEKVETMRPRHAVPAPPEDILTAKAVELGGRFADAGAFDPYIGGYLCPAWELPTLAAQQAFFVFVRSLDGTAFLSNPVYGDGTRRHHVQVERFRVCAGSGRTCRCGFRV